MLGSIKFFYQFVYRVEVRCDRLEGRLYITIFFLLQVLTLQLGNMPQLTDDAFVSEIAGNSIPTTDRLVANPSPTPLVVAPQRDYNTNNWSVHEMLVLQAAKLEFESSLRAQNHHPRHHHSNKIREKDIRISSKERWTWIENACWNAGVFRSQKQCHDKWEGVTTQFRKVAKFNEKIMITSSNTKNPDAMNVVEDYWSMSQLARKQNKLPANFSREVFDALRKNHFGGGGGNQTASDYSALRLGFTSNHHVVGEDEAARCPPNKKSRLETSDEEGLESIATAISRAVQRADERHQELMEFERAKLEFEKEKFHGFANLGNGFMRMLISIQEAIRERLDCNHAAAHGKS